MTEAILPEIDSISTLIPEIDSISTLIKEGNELVNLSLSAEVILERLDGYLLQFDDLARKMSELVAVPEFIKSNSVEKLQLIEELKRLFEQHRQIIDFAGKKQLEIGGKIAETYKRAEQIKRYLDPYPSRITIAGKRQG